MEGLLESEKPSTYRRLDSFRIHRRMESYRVGGTHANGCPSAEPTGRYPLMRSTWSEADEAAVVADAVVPSHGVPFPYHRVPLPYRRVPLTVAGA